jgi:hypothetical protein
MNASKRPDSNTVATRRMHDNIRHTCTHMHTLMRFGSDTNNLASCSHMCLLQTTLRNACYESLLLLCTSRLNHRLPVVQCPRAADRCVDQTVDQDGRRGVHRALARYSNVVLELIGDTSTSARQVQQLGHASSIDGWVAQAGNRYQIAVDLCSSLVQCCFIGESFLHQAISKATSTNSSGLLGYIHCMLQTEPLSSSKMMHQIPEPQQEQPLSMIHLISCLNCTVSSYLVHTHIPCIMVDCGCQGCT